MPVIRAPAGAILGGQNIGGRFMSFTQLQTSLEETRAVATARGQVILQPIYSYESRMTMIEAALLIRCHAACKETAEDVLLAAKTNLADIEAHPYATGPLADSLEVVELDRVADYGVISDLEYAPYVEFGTVHAAPHPYIWPAVQANRDSFISKQAAAIEEACQ